MQFYDNPSGESRVVPNGYDGQTDGHKFKKLIFTAVFRICLNSCIVSTTQVLLQSQMFVLNSFSLRKMLNQAQ